MRNGQGNADLLTELIKTLYLTCFVCEQNRHDSPLATYLAAEAVFVGYCRDRCGEPEAILCTHDTQLASTPLHRVEAAKVRLDRLLKEGRFAELNAIRPVRG
ncbi:hypothetical protein AWB80_04185 [Caballeronia pedi]|uniref:Uncharacterized protein n=1 Tax=Caballeronia pedi TaxID=1777141 RepID=A0A158BUW2_9BURK|nr:hypothetical protein [Caballeronia pedi]SAK73894.1 hypothetical protein AWB80_04185 [Caballeronia pedi]